MEYAVFELEDLMYGAGPGPYSGIQKLCEIHVKPYLNAIGTNATEL